MSPIPEERVPADRDVCGATRLVRGVLLVWLSPVILLVMAIGLVGMAASGSFALASRLAPGRASSLPAALTEPMNHAA
jgi:hypothetical protein